MVELNENRNEQLTKEEAAIYDRQIRLWGVEAQQRLRKAKVLLVGLNSLGNEVCKNIVLAGIQHLTLLDHNDITEKDIKQQFLSPHENIGKNKGDASYKRVKELNPMVDIVVDKEHIDNKTDGYFKQFDVVCMTGCCSKLLVKINEKCRKYGIKYISGNVFGYYGYMFADFGEHKYVQEKQKMSGKKKDTCDGPSSAKQTKQGQDETPEYIENITSFCSLSDALTEPLFEKKSLRQAKQVSKSYLVMQVLHEYHEKHQTYPEKLTSNEDFEDLIEIRNNVFERLRIDNDLLDEHHLSYCFGQLYPVNAIVGGVIGQEIIKAVSAKDPPHNNFFFYDGVSTSGVVEKIAPAVHEEKKAETSNVTHTEIVL